MRVFKEEQRFTQPWLLILLGISVVLPLVTILNYFYKENSAMSLKECSISIALVTICIIPIFCFKLITRIDEIGIHFQLFQFQLSLKTIPWSELSSAQKKTYDAISKYGGWGLKSGALWNKKKGRSYNVYGDTGIQLHFKNGTKILIGTQKQQDVNLILNTYETNINQNNI